MCLCRDICVISVLTSYSRFHVCSVCVCVCLRPQCSATAPPSRGRRVRPTVSLCVFSARRWSRQWRISAAQMWCVLSVKGPGCVILPSFLIGLKPVNALGKVSQDIFHKYSKPQHIFSGLPFCVAALANTFILIFGWVWGPHVVAIALPGLHLVTTNTFFF